MKKLITVLMLFVGIKSYSQYGGTLDYFNKKPAYEMMTDVINEWYGGMIPINDSKFIAYANEHSYSFIENKKLYMLSYEPCNNCDGMFSKNEIKKRNIYLYVYFNKQWIIASTDLIQTDYMTYSSYDNYYPLRDEGGSVIKQKNNNIEIQLTRFFMKNTLDLNEVPTFYYSTITLTPNNDGSYKLIEEKSLITEK